MLGRRDVTERDTIQFLLIPTTLRVRNSTLDNRYRRGVKKCRVRTLDSLRLEQDRLISGEGNERVRRIESVEGRRGREEEKRDERVNGGRGGITYYFHPEREREREVSCKWEKGGKKGRETDERTSGEEGREEGRP